MQRIYVISCEAIPEELNKIADELTNEEFMEISGNWYFESWEEFVNSFNNNDCFCPTPDFDYIRVIEVNE